MDINVGRLDRIIRIALGLALTALALLGAIGPWGYFGVLPLLTGLVGVCPAYRLLGIDTCDAQRR